MLSLIVGIFEGMWTQFAFFGFKKFCHSLYSTIQICDDSLICEVYCTLCILSLEFYKRKLNDPISNSFYTEEY